ncbi:MAG TPA: M14 family metallopeptidase, partial [Gemmataceae bacterium]|nr:M14 family metallopeptidase [Gemmataceae bacterium]
VDADNIDPNRNFLSPGEAYAGSPETYRYFNTLLNPERPMSWRDVLFPLRAYLGVMRHGLPALKQALVGGQYDFPKGLFFGGHGPSRVQAVLAEQTRGWVGPAGAVVHLDFHTGLGPWGTYKLLLDTPMNPAHRGRLDRWFGRGTWEEDDPRGLSYLPRGGYGPWCMAQDFAPDYLFAVAEFGTYGGITMLTGLRAENQAHHWGRPDDPGTVRAKARLRELFVPASPAWRAKVLTQGLELVEQALGAAAAAPVLARGPR